MYLDQCLKCDKLFVALGAAWNLARVPGVGRTKLPQVPLMVGIRENFIAGRALELDGVQEAPRLLFELRLLVLPFIFAHSAVASRE